VTDLPAIENGAARVEAGAWLMHVSQPSAVFGTTSARGLKGLLVPDRASLRSVTTTGRSWCASASRPFLTLVTALPDEPLNAVSAKILVAPSAARIGGRNLRLVPMSLKGSSTVTSFRQGWTVLATRSRVTRLALADGETLGVKPEALVAWTGRDPSGFCPKLSVLDMLLPRGPKNLVFSFHGPAVVWFEGSEIQSRRRTVKP